MDRIKVPLPTVIPKSPYRLIADHDNSFKSWAKRCAMGDLEAMLWMFWEFRGRLTQEYRSLEEAYIRDFCVKNREILNDYLEKHQDDSFHLQAAHMWLNRAALYGSQKAEQILEETPFFRQGAYFTSRFQSPGQNQGRSCSGADMKAMGFLDFDEKVSYYLDSLNQQRIYTASCYASYDGSDETGFGMENEYDYFFFDEFFRLLFILRSWSRLDIANNQVRIQTKCREKEAEMQKKRDGFWRRYQRKTDMERYHSCSLKYDLMD